MLARLLTPAQFGIVAMVAPLVGLVQLFAELGLTQAVIQRPSLTHRELSGLFWINGAVSLGLAALLAAASPLVAAFYGEPKTMAVTASLAVPLVLGGFAAQQMALMSRRLQFTALASIDVGSTAASAAVGILCAWCGLGYWSLVAMQAANNAANLAAAWAVSGWRPGKPRLDAAVTPLLRFGGDVTGYNLVNYLSFNLDNVLIGWASGVGALGLYDRAFRLMLPSVMQLTTPFTRITVPLLSRLQAEPDRYRSSFAQVLRALLLATLPGLAWSIVFADQAITALLGARWQAAGPILAALGAGALLLPVNNAVAWLFISQGRTREQLVWGAAGSGIVLAVGSGRRRHCVRGLCLGDRLAAAVLGRDSARSRGVARPLGRRGPGGAGHAGRRLRPGGTARRRLAGRHRGAVGGAGRVLCGDGCRARVPPRGEPHAPRYLAATQHAAGRAGQSAGQSIEGTLPRVAGMAARSAPIQVPGVPPVSTRLAGQPPGSALPSSAHAASRGCLCCPAKWPGLKASRRTQAA